jgi:PAS domain S-box-containing protein
MGQSSPVRILLLMDKLSDCELVQYALQGEGWEYDIDQIHSKEFLWDKLAKFEPRILVMESIAPDLIATLQTLSQNKPGMSIIILGDTHDEMRIVECIKAGAANYLSFNHLSRLAEVIQKTLASFTSRVLPPSSISNEKILSARFHLIQYAYHHSLEELLQETLDQLCDLTNSSLGFYHFIEADQKTLNLQAWSTQTMQRYCQAEGIDLHYNLDQAGVWADCVRQRCAVVHNNYPALENRKGYPEGHALITRELIVPVFRNTLIVAILGVGNKPTDYDQADLELVSSFADLTWDIAEKKRMELDLQTSENRFRSFVENANDIVYSLSPAGIFTYISPNWQEILGHSEAEVLGKSFESFVHPDDISNCWHFIKQTLTTGEKQSGVEYRIHHKNGEWRWHTTNASPIKDTGGTSISFFGIARDITERKLAEEKLLASETSTRKKLKAITEPESDLAILELADILDQEAFQSLMDDFYNLTHVGIGIIDTHGKILVAKGWQTICTQFHRAQPETLKNCLESDQQLTQQVIPGTFKCYKCKNNMWDISTPITLGGRHLGNIFLGQFLYDDEVLDETLFRNQARQYGFDEEAYMAALAQIPRWSHQMVETVVLFYTKLAGLISSLSFSNIRLSRFLHEKEQLLAQLSESEARYHLLIDAAPIAVLITREDSYEYANPAGLKLLGYSSLEEFAGTKILDTVHPDSRPRVIERLENLKKGFTNPPAELKLLRQNGTHLFAESTSIPIQLNGKSVSLVLSQDITEQKLAEQKARKNESRLQSLYEISQYEAKDIQELLDYSLSAAIRLTDSKIGYIYFYDERTQVFTLNSWSSEVMKECAVMEPQTIYQLEKTGLWGEAVRQRQPILDNHYQVPGSLKKGIPSGHVPLEKFLTIPVFVDHEIVAVVGVANKQEDYDQTDILQLSLLINSVWKMVQRKQGEAVLRENAEQLQTIINTSLDGYIIVKQDGAIQDVNDAYCQIIGYSKEELLQLTISDLEKNEHPEATTRHIQTILSNGTDRFETRHQHKNGQIIDLEISTTYMPLKGYLLTFARDISERQRAFRELRESEARFKAVSEYSHNAICLIEESGKIVWINQAFMDMGGYSKEQIYAAASFAEFLAPESLDFVIANFLEFVKNEPYQHHYTFYFTRADGQKRLCEKHMTDYEDRQGKRILAISMVDITERKLAEDQLKRWEHIFQNAEWGIVVGSADGKTIELTNPAFSRMHGFTENELIGRQISDMFAPESRGDVSHSIQLAHEKGHHVWESIHLHKNGSKFPVLIDITTVRDEAGQILYRIANVQDITERKRLEQAVNQQLEELRRWYNVTLGREDRILELKREVNKLLTEMGKQVRYASAVEESHE